MYAQQQIQMDIGCVIQIGLKQSRSLCDRLGQFLVFHFFGYWNLKIALFTKLPNICKSKMYS